MIVREFIGDLGWRTHPWSNEFLVSFVKHLLVTWETTCNSFFFWTDIMNSLLEMAIRVNYRVKSLKMDTAKYSCWENGFQRFTSTQTWVELAWWNCFWLLPFSQSMNTMGYEFISTSHSVLSLLDTLIDYIFFKIYIFSASQPEQA